MSTPSHMETEDYDDHTLVYVNPDTRTIIGPVQWESDERPKKLPYEQENAEKKTKRTYYPYCTIRTAKHFLWKKRPLQEDRKLSLDNALQKIATEPFWN